MRHQPSSAPCPKRVTSSPSTVRSSCLCRVNGQYLDLQRIIGCGILGKLCEGGNHFESCDLGASTRGHQPEQPTASAHINRFDRLVIRCFVLELRHGHLDSLPVQIVTFRVVQHVSVAIVRTHDGTFACVSAQANQSTLLTLFTALL
jgi:hypothetical protein